MDDEKTPKDIAATEQAVHEIAPESPRQTEDDWAEVHGFATNTDEADDYAKETKAERAAEKKRRKRRERRARAEAKKWEAARERRLEKLRAERAQPTAELGFAEAHAATQTDPTPTMAPEDDGEIANLRLAFGNDWIKNPAAQAMRETWWAVETNPITGELCRVPVTPEADDGCWQPVFPGSHEYIWKTIANRQYRNWLRRRPLKVETCPAPAKGKAGKAGEKCGERFIQQRSDQVYCGDACRSRAAYWRKKALELAAG